MNIRTRIILVFIFLVQGLPYLFSQAFYEAYLYGEDQHLRAVAAVQLLHESALVIRLKSNNNKLSKLNEFAISDQIDEKQRQKYKKEADMLRLKTLHEQRVWIGAFIQNYDFSKVYFLEDSDYKTFLSGDRKGIFMNEQGEKDVQIKFNHLHYLVAGFGSSKQADQYSGGTGVFIMDPRGNELNNPFPHYFTAGIIDQAIGLMMNDGSREQRNAEKIVKRLQKKLEKYCSKVCGDILPPVTP